MTYAEYCATKCEGCHNKRPIARGIFRLGAKPMHDHSEPTAPHVYMDCTAPSRDQFEQELRERIAELERNYDATQADYCHSRECISELEREIENWKSLYKTECDIVAGVWKALGNPTYESLQGRTIYDCVEELRKDKARLDWMETQNHNFAYAVYCGGPWTMGEDRSYGVWKIEDLQKGTVYALGKHKTAREAFDAAMQSAGEQPEA